jgi:O-antigen ligase
MNTVSGNRFGDILGRLWKKISKSFFASFFIVPESFIISISHESTVDRAWPKSRIYKIADWVANLIPGALSALYLRFQKFFDESLVFSMVQSLSDEMGVISGLFMFFILVIPQDYWNNMFSLFGAIALVFLFFVYAMRKKGRIRTELIGPYILLFAFFVGLSFISSYYVSLSFRFVIFHLTCMLLVPVLLSVLDDKRQLNNFIYIMLAGLSVSVLYGCYQTVVGVPVVLWQIDVTANAGMPGRVFSFFENPNAFAEVLSMLVPYYVAVLFNNKNRYVRLVTLMLFLASGGVMVMTLSRAGYIAFAAEFALAIMFYNWKLVPLFAVFGVLSLPFMPATISRRIITIFTGDSSISSRTYTYNSALKLLIDHFALGVGLGVDPAQKIVNVNSYYSNGYKFIHAHNTYLQIWIETGLFGLIAFLAAMANWFKQSASWIVDKKSPKDLKNIILAGTAGVLGVLIFGLVDYVWFYPRIMVIFWVVVAVTMAAVRLTSDEVK